MPDSSGPGAPYNPLQASRRSMQSARTGAPSFEYSVTEILVGSMKCLP